MDKLWALVLSSAAKEDLLNIADYTEQQWGEEQRDRYLLGIAETLEKVRLNPLASIERGYWRPGLRSVTHQQQYYIIFRVVEAEQEIQIVRVLHSRRNFAEIFDSE